MGRELTEWLIAGMMAWLVWCVVTGRGVAEWDCLKVGMVDGGVAEWWDWCWAGVLTGSIVGLRVGSRRGEVAMMEVDAL